MSRPALTLAATTLAALTAAASPSAASAQSTPPLPNMRVSVDLHEVPVRDIVEWIADASGTNIVLSDTVTGTVTLRVDDMPISILLREVLLAADLGWCATGATIEVGDRCR